MERAQKERELQYLTDRFGRALVALCTDYRGLTVAQVTELRRALRGAGAEAKVVKNTLAKISLKAALKDAKESELEQFSKLFDGPSFVVFADADPVSPAKTMTKYAKDLQPFKIKGGWFDGTYLDEAKVVELSNMPSREETLAKLLCLLNTPATQLVRLLSAPAQQTVQVVDAHRAKLEAK